MWDEITSSHTLKWMKLLIHAGINVKTMLVKAATEDNLKYILLIKCNLFC